MCLPRFVCCRSHQVLPHPPLPPPATIHSTAQHPNLPPFTMHSTAHTHTPSPPLAHLAEHAELQLLVSLARPIEQLQWLQTHPLRRNQSGATLLKSYNSLPGGYQ